MRIVQRYGVNYVVDKVRVRNGLVMVKVRENVRHKFSSSNDWK